MAQKTVLVITDGIGESDGVIFINFRDDRVREIAAALGDENFKRICAPFRR